VYGNCPYIHLVLFYQNRSLNKAKPVISFV